MVWSPDKNYNWSPNDMSDEEIKILLHALHRDEEYKQLHAKIWSWNINYRDKNYGLS